MSERLQDRELDDLYEQYDDICFRIATTEIAAERVQKAMTEIEDDPSGETDQQIKQMSERLRPRIYELIDKSLNASVQKQFFRHKLPRACIAALCVIGALSIGAVSAIASSSYVRHMLMELFIQIDDEYTQYSLVEKTGSEFDVPADWPGHFYPSYIPDGYSFVEVVNATGVCIAHYADGHGNRFSFSECDVHIIARVDNGDSSVVRTTVNGAEASYASHNGKTTLTWSANNVYFVVSVDDTPEKALHIAESVTLINYE